MWRAKPRKKLTGPQVKAYLLQQLTAAYGASVLDDLARHIDAGGDVYVSIAIT